MPTFHFCWSGLYRSYVFRHISFAVLCSPLWLMFVHYFLPFLLLQSMYFSSLCQTDPAKSLSPFINGIFFQIWAAKKLENLFFLAAHAPNGPLFFRRKRRPCIVDVLGHWELTLIQRWRAEGMVVFLPNFIYFARLVAIIDRSDRNNNIIYLFKQF